MLLVQVMLFTKPQDEKKIQAQVTLCIICCAEHMLEIILWLNSSQPLSNLVQKPFEQYGLFLVLTMVTYQVWDIVSMFYEVSSHPHAHTSMPGYNQRHDGLSPRP